MSVRATQAGISYSSQKPVFQKGGKKIVLSNNNNGNGAGATTSVSVRNSAATNLTGATREPAYTKVKTSKDVGLVASSNFKLAQRSGTASLYSNQFDYSGLRNSLNRNTGFVGNQTVYANAPMPQMNCGNNTNKYAAAMMAMNLLSEGIGMLGGLNKSSDTTPGDSVKKGADAAKGKSGAEETSSYTGMDAMKGAKDSVSLRDAISTAEADKTKMKSELTQIESGLDAKKADAEKAKADMDCIKKEVKEQKAVVKEKEDEVKGAEKNVSEAKAQVGRTKEQVNVAENRLSAADTAFNQASTALASAESNLAKTPATKAGPDGIPVSNEPALTNAKKAVDTAKANKQAALDDLKAAEGDKKVAAENYKAAVKKHENAESGLKEASERFETAKAGLEKEQQTLKELEDKQKSAENSIDSYEKDLKQQEKLTKDIKKYDEEIKEQGDRLTKLEKKDDEDLKKVDGKMNELQSKMGIREDKIDTTDGKNTLREKIAAKKNDKALGKFDALLEERNEIQNKIDVRSLMNNVPEQITDDGQAMRKGTGTDGKAIYMIGPKIVDEDAYNTRLGATKNVLDSAPLNSNPVGLNGLSKALDLANTKLSPNGNSPAKPAQTANSRSTVPSSLKGPTTEAKLELLEKGSMPNGVKIGDKIVKYEQGKFIVNGQEVKRSDLEQLS